MIFTTPPLAVHIAAILFLGLVSGCANITSQQHNKCFRLGQIWSYDTRPGEEQSRLSIVEAYTTQENHRMYVVRVTGVKIDSPYFRNYFPDEIPFFILHEAGLEASVKSVVGESNWNKHFDKSFQQWRKDQRYQDFYGHTIKEKLDTIEEMLNIKLGA